MIRKYDKYKDSGVEWIGEIPEGWEIKKIKYLAKIKTGYTPSKMDEDNYSEDGIIWVKPDNLDQFNPIYNSKEKISKQGLKEQNVISKGSVLVCCIGTIGKFGIAGVDLLTNQQINSVTYYPIINAEYGKYLVYSSEEEHIRQSNGNVVKILNSESQSNIQFAFPSLLEQTAIAAFLDRKTAELDQLITRKEKLIMHYEEEKTAIINHAVTKGLDPKVMTRPSGIEWLGDIPEHWEVKRLKYLVGSLESGVSVNATDFPAIGNEYGILKTSCVYNYIFNALENKAIWESELNRAKVSPKKGSIIISRMNTPDLVGASGYVEDDYPTLFLPDRLWQTVFFQDVEISAKWLSYILKCNSFRKLLSITATGTSPSMKNLGQEDFLNISIPFMEIGEQSSIVTHIETECSRLDTIIEKFKKQIDLLKEYRTTLISEVVTGKIDVRDEVAA